MTVLDELVIKITADGSGVTTGMNQAGQAVTSFSDRISKTSTTLRGLGDIGMHTMGMLDRMEISSMSVSNALMSMQDAQMRYNTTLSEFGEGSEQAAIAQNSLERAMNQYESAQLRANMSLASMGITMIGMVPQFITFGRTAITTLKGVELATLATTVRIKAMAPELLVLSVVAGGAYYLMTSQARAAEEANISLGDSYSYVSDRAENASDKIARLKDEITALDEKIKQEKESKSGTQKQTLMGQYLEYHIRDENRTDIRPAMSREQLAAKYKIPLESVGEFLGDLSDLPPGHPFYQPPPSPTVQKLEGEREELGRLVDAAQVQEYITKGTAIEATRKQELLGTAMVPAPSAHPSYGADRGNSEIAENTRVMREFNETHKNLKREPAVININGYLDMDELAAKVAMRIAAAGYNSSSDSGYGRGRY